MRSKKKGTKNHRLEMLHGEAQFSKVKSLLIQLYVNDRNRGCETGIIRCITHWSGTLAINYENSAAFPKLIQKLVQRHAPRRLQSF